MAHLTRWALFWRAFFVTLIFGSASQAQDAAERAAWEKARSSNTPEAIFDYLGRYPAGVYIDQAVNALNRLGAIGTSSRSRSIAGQRNAGQAEAPARRNTPARQSQGSRSEVY